MKDKVKVSLIQFAPVWLDREKSAERMRHFAEEEAQGGSELIVFPELSNIGYITPVTIGQPPSYDSKTTAAEFAMMYTKASESVPGLTTNMLGEVTKKYGVYIIVGISQLHPVITGTLYNSAVLIGPEGVIGVHNKMHIPLNERYYFYPGSTADVYRTDLGNIGMTVCYDGRFPELPRILSLKGAEIICAIWNTPGVAHMDPESHKYRVHVRAQENGIYFLSCNRSGKEGDITFLGHSAMAKPDGGIIAYSDTDQEEVLTAEIYNEEIIKFRAALGVFRDRRPEMYSIITEPLSPPLPYVPMPDIGNRGQIAEE